MRHADAPGVHSRAHHRLRLRRLLRGIRLVGCIGPCSASPSLIFRGLMIASEAPTVFSRLLAARSTLSFFTYAFVNMGMVSGILPVVGRAAALHQLRRHRRW